MPGPCALAPAVSAALVQVGRGRTVAGGDSFGIFEAFQRRRRSAESAGSPSQNQCALPEREQLAGHLKQLIAEHGVETVASSLIEACHHSELLQLTRQLWEHMGAGVEPEFFIRDASVQVSALQCRTSRAPCTARV